MKKQESLTSVKIDKQLYEDFKIEAFKSNFSLKKLVETGIINYLTDKEFKSKLHNTKTTK